MKNLTINVGDYVRTHDGRIDKIVDIKNDFIYIENSDYGYRENYLKSSSNIIDLIEVGDYVNGIQINERIGDSVWHFSAYGDEDECLESKDIKTIVTHEQMEAMGYKIER